MRIHATGPLRVRLLPELSPRPPQAEKSTFLIQVVSVPSRSPSRLRFAPITLKGVLVNGTNGIVVSAGATDRIVLEGLDIEGLGTGLNGDQRVIDEGVPAVCVTRHVDAAKKLSLLTNDRPRALAQTACVYPRMHCLLHLGRMNRF